MKIYVASSWRNPVFFDMIAFLHTKFPNHEVYNFREANSAFHWKELQTEISDGSPFEWWKTEQYINALNHPLAEKAYQNDFVALDSSQVVILLNPCGESAHMEAAYHCGKGLPVIDFYPIDSNNIGSKSFSLELMKKMFQYRCMSYEILEMFIRFSIPEKFGFA